MVDIKISAVHVVSEKQSKLKNVHLVLRKTPRSRGSTHGWECKLLLATERPWPSLITLKVPTSYYSAPPNRRDVL